MKVVMFTAMYPPIKTGTSFYSKNLASTLRNRGHDVKIVTLVNDEVTLPEEHVVRLPAIHIDVKNYFRHFRISSLFPANYYRASKLIREDRPDAILLINQYLDIAFVALFISVRHQLPLYISIGTQLQSLSPFRKKVLNLLDSFICGRLILPFCRKIISWDSEIERYLNDVHNGKFAEKSVIIPFGVNGDPAAYARHAHSYELHNQILGVGAVIDHRSFLFLVEVFRKIAAFLPNLTVKIVGHVYKRDAIELCDAYGFADRVAFVGEQPHEAVLDEMNKSDVHWMMLDGDYKGLGTSNLEAMLMGLPIVSNIPANLFGLGTLTDMDSYVYTDGKSLDAISDKLLSLFASRELRERIGSNGRRFVEDNMNWDIVGRKMETLIAPKQCSPPAAGTGPLHASS